AWFAGLIGLESGRLAGWRTWRLGVGSFLVTLASTIHYPASFAWLGVLVYVVWAYRHAPAWKRAVAALVAGGCVCGIPYLVGFVIPHGRDVLAFIGAVEGTGQEARLAAHAAAYATEYAEHADNAVYRFL